MMAGFEIERWRAEGMTSRLQESRGVVGACPTCGYYVFKEPWPAQPPDYHGGACLACDVLAGDAGAGLKVLHEIFGRPIGNGDHHGG